MYPSSFARMIRIYPVLLSWRISAKKTLWFIGIKSVCLTIPILTSRSTTKVVFSAWRHTAIRIGNCMVPTLH